MKAIGYDRPLFIQPFDHRGSFTKGFFGIAGQPEISPAHDQHNPIAEVKTLIYRGLLRAIELGVARESVGILIDTQFGSAIVADAKDKGIPVAVCVEKSGQDTFDFEYGPAWQDHIRFIRPNMVKVLVRYHPDADLLANREQAARLKMLSDFLHASDDHHFMFELLVPPLTSADKEAGAAFDTEIRPRLMIRAIRELQDLGVEPDIWKIEGLDRTEDARAIAAQVRNTPERASVGCILLGRGSDAAQVYQWLRVAAPVDGFIGFAVGRTNFKEPVKRFLENPTEEVAAASIEAIAHNYKSCVDTWRQAAG